MDAEESRNAFSYALVQLDEKRPELRFQLPPAQADSAKPVSPLMRLLARAVPWRVLPGNPKLWLRLPLIFAGMMLGLSVWIIARRWYAATGGLIALAIFSFSVPLIHAGARFAPDIVAAWGIYGVVFAAIAIAHACYAAPGTVSAGSKATKVAMFALALGVGAAAWPSWWFAVAVGLAFGFSLYLLRSRRPPIVNFSLLFGESVALGLALLLGLLNLCWRQTGSSIRVGYSSISWPAIPKVPHWPLAVMLAAAFITWLARRRSRWFGNTAPLIAAIVFAFADGGLFALPFAALFIAGLFSDLLESQARTWRVAIPVLLVSNAAVALWVVLKL